MQDRKLAAIVFTDIVGYTKRMEANEDHTMRLLARQREIIFPIVKEFGGEVIKEIGDGLLMMFNSANRAVRFAMAIQEKLKNDELTIRAGIHIGDVIFEGGDVFGSAVNIAARIEPLAPEGGICISEDVRSQIRNQHDIITTSVGKKELKGVKEHIEIYCVISKEEKESLSRVPFFKDLWQRRVIQVAVIYLLASFLITRVVNFFVIEYLLSPHLVDLAWFILLLLLPSVILVTYFHGRRGVNKWKRVEIIGMPLNLVVAALVILFVFKGRDLGAMTTTLTVQNEEGEDVEMLVMKKEFRKKLLLFSVENVSSDTTLDYLQYSIPVMTEYDLAQDLLITPQHSLRLLPQMVDAGYEKGVGLPITLMKSFAQKYHMNYFMTGTLDREEGMIVLNAKLYDTQFTRLIEEFTLRNEDPFELVDQLTIQIKGGMGLPESHVAETIDLPVSEIFTSSEQAMNYFTDALREEVLNNWEQNVRYLDMAIQADPGFAIAHLTIGLAYFRTNDFEKTQQALESVMERYLHKLPERHQFIAKYVYYVLGQQPEKALAVVKMWADLFPDDLTAHTTLAQRYAVRNMFPEAIHEYKEILRLDPEQYQVLLTLGDQYMRMGEMDSALLYYEKYSMQLPQESQAYTKLGYYHRMNGDMERAQEYYENALAVADASEKASVMNYLASILRLTGKFDMAMEQYQEMLAGARTSRDSARVLDGKEKLFATKGQVKKALEIFEEKASLYKKILPPKDFMVYRVFNIEPYVMANELERAFDILEGIAEKLEPPLDNLVPFGYMMIYTETGETEKAMAAATNAEELIQDFGEEMLMANIYYTNGRVNEALGEYDQAINDYLKTLEINATSFELHVDIARCWRNLKENKKAKEEIQVALKYNPYDPLSHYEAALINLETGDKAVGMEHLEKAVEIWKDADEDYEKANVAKEKLESLRSRF